jgi:hypothetical protein
VSFSCAAFHRFWFSINFLESGTKNFTLFSVVIYKSMAGGLGLQAFSAQPSKDKLRSDELIADRVRGEVSRKIGEDLKR